MRKRKVEFVSNSGSAHEIRLISFDVGEGFLDGAINVKEVKGVEE